MLIKTDNKKVSPRKQDAVYCQDAQSKESSGYSLEQPILLAADIIKTSKKCIALTGAGISVDSNVPDYRGTNGMWSKFPPEEYASLQAYTDNPGKVWKCWSELAKYFVDKKPNAGHLAMVELERLGYLKAILTQNIDALHQQAGHLNVIEFDGNIRRLTCLKCNNHHPFNIESIQETPPYCNKCGGLMKPDMIIFGERINKEVWERTLKHVKTCDVMVVVGTSGNVSPASELPILAKEHGAYIVEFNLTFTVYTNGISDLFVQGTTSQTMPHLVQLLHGNI